MSWDKTKDELREEFSRQVNKRKPTAKWCKGKVGREHEVELVVNHNYDPAKVCEWRPLYTRRTGIVQVYRWHYSCRHSYRCRNCGKYTEYWLKNVEECPDYQPRVT